MGEHHPILKLKSSFKVKKILKTKQKAQHYILFFAIKKNAQSLLIMFSISCSTIGNKINLTSIPLPPHPPHAVLKVNTSFKQKTGFIQKNPFNIYKLFSEVFTNLSCNMVWKSNKKYTTLPHIW